MKIKIKEKELKKRGKLRKKWRKIHLYLWLEHMTKALVQQLKGNPNQLGEKQERKKPKTKDQMVENRKNLSAKRGSTITRLN